MWAEKFDKLLSKVLGGEGTEPKVREFFLNKNKYSHVVVQQDKAHLLSPLADPGHSQFSLTAIQTFLAIGLTVPLIPAVVFALRHRSIFSFAASYRRFVLSTPFLLTNIGLATGGTWWHRESIRKSVSQLDLTLARNSELQMNPKAPTQLQTTRKPATIRPSAPSSVLL